MQPDAIAWHASAFASRSPFYSDFFEILCHKAVAEEIVRQRGATETDCILVLEDPWLAMDLQLAFGAKANVVSRIKAGELRRERARLLALGIAARARFVAGLFLARWLPRLFRGKATPDPVAAAGKAVCIVSVSEPQALRGGGFSDPYFPGLEEMLRDHGSSSLRLLRPMRLPGPYRAKDGVTRSTWPLGLDTRVRDGVFAFRRWTPRMPAAPTIDGIDVSRLMAREVAVAFSRGQFNSDLALHAAFKRFLRHGWTTRVTYIFENQPWERMLVAAARAQGGVMTIGYQHSTIPRMLLSHVIPGNTSTDSFLPDRLITNGPLPTRLLAEGGFPPDRLIEGGSFRFQYLLEPSADPMPAPRTKRQVLIALPLDAAMSRSIVQSAVRAAADPTFSEWRFIVKPHPDVEATFCLPPEAESETVMVARGTFGSHLAASDIVVGGGSTTIEAWLQGKTVLRTRFATRLDLDPASATKVSGIHVVDEDHLCKALVAAAQEFKATSPRRGENDFFGPVKSEVWLRELGVAA
jgi:hypothetical protein